MTISQTKTEKAYFLGNARFGRTTKLVCKVAGVVLVEVMGVATRTQAWEAYRGELAKART